MSKDRKRMIVDVLTQFYQSDLASHDAREWIAEEIVKKLDNEKHEDFLFLDSYYYHL